MRLLRSLIDAPSRLLLLAACLATYGMMLHVVADIAGKYLFNRPLRGTIEIVSYYYMVIGVFFPLAYITLERAHLVVELFTRKLGQRVLLALHGATGLITCALMTVLTWMVVDEAVVRTLAGEVWETGYGPMLIWPSRWIIAIGSGAMAIAALAMALRDFGRMFASAR